MEKKKGRAEQKSLFHNLNYYALIRESFRLEIILDYTNAAATRNSLNLFPTR